LVLQGSQADLECKLHRRATTATKAALVGRLHDSNGSKRDSDHTRRSILTMPGTDRQVGRADSRPLWTTGKAVEAMLQDAADQINADGPRRVDATTLVRASAAGRTLTYHYEVAMGGRSRTSLRDFVTATVVPNVCRGAQRPPMVEQAISYTYRYTPDDGAEPVAITIDEQTCRALEG
jgi:hypothetical protein